MEGQKEVEEGERKRLKESQGQRLGWLGEGRNVGVKWVRASGRD